MEPSPPPRVAPTSFAAEFHRTVGVAQNEVNTSLASLAGALTTVGRRLQSSSLAIVKARSLQTAAAKKAVPFRCKYTIEEVLDELRFVARDALTLDSTVKYESLLLMFVESEARNNFQDKPVDVCFLVGHPKPAPSLHPRLRGRRCRGLSVGAMEVDDCSVVGIVGLEPWRVLPSGLADEVVKKEEGTYLWGGGCSCSGRAENHFVADEKVAAVSPETKGRPQVEEARQDVGAHRGIFSNTMVA